MTKTQIKSIALNAVRQLNAIHKDIYNRDLVTAINHDQLKTVSTFLNDLYGALDVNYKTSLKADIDEAMEYTELVNKRIEALAEYIRPNRIKSEHVSPKRILDMVANEQQALHHLSTLLDDIQLGSATA